ncbi:MAG: hypothetical protein ACRCY4_00435 [Brevinema sp.]
MKIKLDANLGDSFKNRKDALIKERDSLKDLLYWILGLTLLVTIGSYFLVYSFNPPTIKLTTFVEYLSFLYSSFVGTLPIFLIIWFIIRYFVRRVNEMDHLIEEYANKEALSLSFARYKEAFKEIAGITNDWSALETFTNSTATELIKNPAYIFPKNKTDKMPIKEFKELFTIWNKLPDTNQIALIEALKIFIDKYAQLEIDKRDRESQKSRINQQVEPIKFDSFEDDIPF